MTKRNSTVDYAKLAADLKITAEIAADLKQHPDLQRALELWREVLKTMEILDTIPMDRLFAAACLMRRCQRQDLPAAMPLEVDAVEDVGAFIESFDLPGLERLRRLALEIEGGRGNDCNACNEIRRDEPLH